MGGKHRLPRTRPMFARQLAASTLLVGSVGFVGYLGFTGTDVLYVVPPEPVPSLPVEPTVAPSITPPAPTTTAPPPSSATPAPATTTRRPAPATPRPAPKPAPAPAPKPAAKACPSTGFGGVKAHVAAVSHHVAQRFDLPLRLVLGVGARPQNPTSDHPTGRATDFLVYNDRALGNRIAAYLIQNADRFAISYVIFYDRIWFPGSGWSSYSGYNPHRDHVHASFRSSPPSSLPTC